MNQIIKNIEYLEYSKHYVGLKRKVVRKLLQAINDWPVPVQTLGEFETEIKNFVGDKVVKGTVDDILSRVDYEKHAWEAESLSHLVEVFHHYGDNDSLRDIIDDVVEN